MYEWNLLCAWQTTQTTSHRKLQMNHREAPILGKARHTSTQLRHARMNGIMTPSHTGD